MLDFNTFVSRHGEAGVQALIERVERYENRRAAKHVTLEARWNAVMNAESSPAERKAA